MLKDTNSGSPTKILNNLKTLIGQNGTFYIV